MGKDIPQKTGQVGQQQNMVSKILKNKNKFRAGLGFKENKLLGEEHKVKVNQTVSRKKIVQGTKGDKQFQDEEKLLGHREVEAETKNRNMTDDIEDGAIVSKLAQSQQKRNTDPRALFAAMEKQK